MARLVSLACAAATIALAPTAGGRDAATVTVPDARGDGKTAPDVVSVTVRQPSRARVVVDFRLAPGRELGNGEFLVLFLDVDRNARTGSKDGAEYLLELEQVSPEPQLRLQRYDRETQRFVVATRFAPTRGTRWGGRAAPAGAWRMFFDPAQLRVRGSFAFAARSEGLGDADDYDVDRIPNTGSRVFAMRAAK